MKIKILYSNYNTNPEQLKESKRNLGLLKKACDTYKHASIEIVEDTNKYENKMAECMNVFFDRFRGTDYNYLIWIPNDLKCHRLSIQRLVEMMEDNKDIAIGSLDVVRDIEKFKELKNIKLTKRRNHYIDMETTNFIVRAGVIEEVGRIDEQFPLEFFERDYFYRVRLARGVLAGIRTVAFYHPVESGTIGNSTERLQKALEEYTKKWGGDAFQERYQNPMNDIKLDYKYCIK